MNYKFVNMKYRPLVHDVKCGNKVVIPAGTKFVKIAFRQSHLLRYDEDKQCYVHMNVYLYKGKLYHA